MQEGNEIIGNEDVDCVLWEQNREKKFYFIK